jgi:hypothetical protein
MYFEKNQMMVVREFVGGEGVVLRIQRRRPGKFTSSRDAKKFFALERRLSVRWR